MSQPELATEELARHLVQKHRCLLQLKELGGRQQQLIAASDLTSLLKLLAAKQQVLELLHAADRSLDPFRDEDPEQRVWRSPEARAHCAQLAAECRTLLDEVVALETESERQMQAMRDATAGQLAGAQRAATASQAYASHARSGPPAPHSQPRAARSTTYQGMSDQVPTERLDLTSDT